MIRNEIDIHDVIPQLTDTNLQYRSMPMSTAPTSLKSVLKSTDYGLLSGEVLQPFVSMTNKNLENSCDSTNKQSKKESSIFCFDDDDLPFTRQRSPSTHTCSDRRIRPRVTDLYNIISLVLEISET
jgi:hypothetical protein